MKSLVLTVILLGGLALVSSHPVESSQLTLEQLESSAISPGQESAKELIRDKRTIGILRDLFPNFSQMIDRKIQMLTRIIFRLVGRLVLQRPANGGGGGGGDDDRRVSIVLPTYPPSEDDDEDEDEDEDSTPAASSSDDSDSSASSSVTTTVSSISDDDNSVEESKERRKRQTDDDDFKAESEDNNDVADDSEDDKKFLNFNLGSSSSNGNSAGSGNFLFDVIRLVAGSGNTQESDEAENAPLEGASSEHHEQTKGYDGLGVPGPLTRLFVIANRGVASLIQDLILRLAQTSEKLVNFKARLITSII